MLQEVLASAHLSHMTLLKWCIHVYSLCSNGKGPRGQMLMRATSSCRLRRTWG